MGGTFLVSDVHGYLGDLRAAFADAGLVDDRDQWCGDDAEVWVLGDLVDRGPDGIGVVRFLRGLQERAPGQVHVLMGNHEALMLGYHLFPDSRFAELWLINGGRYEDQVALTDDDVAWLRTLPAMALVDGHLLMHSDTTGYLDWGTSVDEVNATVAQLLETDDAEEHFDVFAALTDRFHFAGTDGADVAREMLGVLGGETIVHGHTFVSILLDISSAEVDGPLRYADGLVIGIDGGRYDGGPLLMVELA